MQIGTLSLVHLQSSAKDWSERRERRSGYRRRGEDETPSTDEGAGPTPGYQAGPSLGFLTQVAAQMAAVKQPPTGVYQTPRWRCGVCADERA